MIRIVLTLVFSSIAGFALAQPEILLVSGSFEHGATAQVSGSGFGEKLMAGPMMWDDLSSPAYSALSDGAPIPTQKGANGHPMDPTAPHATADNPTFEGSTVIRQNGRVSGRPVYALTEPSGWLGPFAKRSSQSLYLDWWMFGSGSADSAEPVGPGNRILRLQAGPDISAGEIKLFENQATYVMGPTPEILGSSYSKLFPGGGGWTHLAVWTDVSGEIDGGGNGTGTLKVWRDGQLIHSVEDLSDQDQGFTQINALGLQASSGAEPGDEYQFGDIYLDDSLARVMIGNTARWENVTHYEMQIPQDWLVTNISFDVNLEGFSESEALFLFISDSSGNINEAGYPVPNGSLGPGQPGQPTIDR